MLLSFLFFLWLSSDHALSMSTCRALGCVVITRLCTHKCAMEAEEEAGEVRCAGRSLLTVCA